MTTLLVDYYDFVHLIVHHRSKIREWIEETAGAAYPKAKEVGTDHTLIEANFPDEQSAILFKLRWL